MLVAAALGARTVVVDPSPAARTRALELGAEHAVDPATGDVADAVVEVTGGGAHVGVDAVGAAATATASVRSLRRRGRHVQVGLLFGAEATPPLPMDRVVAHELSVHGSHGMAAADYPGMLRLVAAGRLDPGLLVGRVVPLADAPDALVAMSGPAQGPGMTVVDLAR